MATDIREILAGVQPRPGKKGMVQQGGQQFNMKIDINGLPDMPCIRCGELEYVNITRIKKMSRTVSPNGQEGNININMMKCIKCGWLFNPKEWEDHNKGMENESQPDPEETASVGKEVKAEPEMENKVMCRKCGMFYIEGNDHQCKDLWR